MRVLVKRILRKYGYPPDLQNYEHERLYGGLQSDRHWMIHVADVEPDIARGPNTRSGGFRKYG